ncbi:MAG TPA: 4-alpha-glucanotransferase, partial [Planctomycetaceae bacterium]|nr:4-alpha-glucanotransferase [Planctomycetaceae bacterium]
MGDLADLGSWAKGHGADLVAHNPMGSSIPLPNQQPSPYFGSSRRFLSVLYLRIEDVTGAELLGPDLDGLARVGRELNRVRLIDRDKVFALKMAALEQIWAKVRPDPRVRELLDADTVGFAGLKAAGSRGLGSEGSGSVGGANDSTALSRHSLYCVLAETYGTGWSSWPPQFRHPDSPAVDGFHRKHSERVDFWRWVHLELDRQHVRAAKAGAGLMADLAVGFDPDGSDAWVDQDMLALDCRIGAPGDDFNPDGQDWGVTPYIPWKLRNAGYEPWLRTMRSSLNNCSA